MVNPVKDSLARELDAVDAQQTPLTPRQRQILELLKAGKVNKEIANELGIGLGTVKQHMVALFKKLHVRNRTMAVSQGIGLGGEAKRTDDEPLVVTGILERRPCVVLCMALPKAPMLELMSNLRQMLTVFALANDGLLLMRKERSVELIFGPQACSEFDVYKAYVAAYKIFELWSTTTSDAPLLRAAIAAGMAIVSMKRNGGCNGDVIASPVIGLARDLAAAATPGRLQFDNRALGLLRLAQPGSICASAALPLADLRRMPWNDSQDLPPLFGREHEWRQVQSRLQGGQIWQKSLVGLQGETGMGKSLFCLHLAQSHRQQGGAVLHLVCQSRQLGPWLYCHPTGEAVAVDALPDYLKFDDPSSRRLVIVDDCQHLKADVLDALLQLSFGQKNSLFLFAGRRLGHALKAHADIIRLERLSDPDINQIVAHYRQADDLDAGQSIVQLAQGVPLFAQFLAKNSEPGKTLPFEVLAVIVSRMDGLKLDRRLLAILAKSDQAISIDALAQRLNESPDDVGLAVDKAVASGVVCLVQQQLFFTHPLLRQAVVESLVE